MRPLTSVVGAEILGLDLSRPLGAAEVALVSGALEDFGVVFFRDQTLTDDQHRDFAANFGVLSHFPFVPAVREDLPEVHVIASEGTRETGVATWHSDATFMAEPPLGTVLRDMHLPEVGGDTLFASSHAAYEALSAPLRELVDNLTATHEFQKHVIPLLLAKPDGHRELEESYQRFPPRSHPVVRTHPVTGRRGLYVNRTFTTRLNELSERENEILLPFLCDHVGAPEFTCRFRWTPGSVAFWDNRAVAHYASPDFEGRRVMHRVVIEGGPVF